MQPRSTSRASDHLPAPPLLTARLRRLLAGRPARVRDLYSDDGAGVYERLIALDRSEIREVLALARRSGGDVLDLAAGGGRLTAPLLRAGFGVTALDLSLDMLQQLRACVGSHPRLRIVRADMTDFCLDQSYPSILLGATSITLLDADARRRMYACVRGHLAPAGSFALTVSTAAGAEQLRRPFARLVRIPGRGGRSSSPSDEFLLVQEPASDGSSRVLNLVRTADLDDENSDSPATVLASRLRVLEAEAIGAELESAQFRVRSVVPVRAFSADTPPGETPKTVLIEASG